MDGNTEYGVKTGSTAPSWLRPGSAGDARSPLGSTATIFVSVGRGAQQANATSTPPTPARSTRLVHSLFDNGIVMIPILRLRVW